MRGHGLEPDDVTFGALLIEFRSTGTPPFLQKWYGGKFFEKKFEKFSVLAGGLGG